MWLLKLPGLACTSPDSARIAAIISLTVVFPLLPVTPITGISKRLRQCSANCPSATVVFSTTRPGREVDSAERLTTAAAPAWRASATKSDPWKCSPSKATNSAPGSNVRVSVDTDVTSTSAPVNLPPITSAISFKLNMASSSVSPLQ